MYWPVHTGLWFTAGKTTLAGCCQNPLSYIINMLSHTYSLHGNLHISIFHTPPSCVLCRSHISNCRDQPQLNTAYYFLFVLANPTSDWLHCVCWTPAWGLSLVLPVLVIQTLPYIWPYHICLGEVPVFLGFLARGMHMFTLCCLLSHWLLLVTVDGSLYLFTWNSSVWTWM